jgi:hypothetical protein
MQIDVLPQDLRRGLLRDDDVLRREQVVDYLKLRRFRQTLLCRAAATLDRTPRPERVASLWVSSSAQAHAAEQQRPGRVMSEAPGGARLTTGDELLLP